MKTIFSKLVTLMLGVFNFFTEDKSANHGMKVSTAGVINRGILGGFSGKVANVIGGSWKGVAYMRSQPLSVANPNTAGQVAQRTAFSDTVAIAQILLTAIIKPLMDRFAGQMSGFNYFVQQNIAEWVSAGVFTWANLRISIGSLLGVDDFAISGSNASDEVSADWTSNAGTGNALAGDLAYVAVYNATQGVWGMDSGNNTRTSGSTTVTMPANVVTGNVLHGYLGFKSADGTRVSTSNYDTQTV